MPPWNQIAGAPRTPEIPNESDASAFGIKVGLRAARRWLTYYLATNGLVTQLFTLDEVAAASLAGKITKSLMYIPDPAPMHLGTQISSIDRLDDARQVFLLFGALTRRKGIFAILDAWTLMSADFQRRSLLRFVGRIGSEDRDEFIVALRNARESYPDATIELEDRFLSEEELSLEVRAADIVLAPYQDHVGSSGVLLWAALAGKPVLAQCSGLMGFQVNRYGLGVAVDCRDPHKIVRALSKPITAKVDKSFLHERSSNDFVRALVNGMIYNDT